MFHLPIKLNKIIILFVIIILIGYVIIIFGDRFFVKTEITDNNKNISENYDRINVVETANFESPNILIVQDEYNYEVEQLRDGTLAITAYNGNENHVIFPSRLFGVNVTEIRFPSNFNNRNMKSFIIGNGIRTIGDNTFGNFNTAQNWFIFTEIIIPNSVIEIGNRAFFRSLSSEKIVNLQLSSRLRSIGNEAFAGYRQIFGQNFEINVKSIILPSTLEFVGNRAFAELTIDYLKIENAFRVNTTSGSSTLLNILNDETHHVFSNSIIRSIEICANLNDQWLNSVFNDRNFINFYISQNRMAGIYLNNGRIWTTGTRQDVNNILANIESTQFSTTITLEPSYRGTTRDPQFQREYEDAVREHDLNNQILPPNLMLPSGESVQERVESGNIYGR